MDMSYITCKSLFQYCGTDKFGILPSVSTVQSWDLYL